LKETIYSYYLLKNNERERERKRKNEGRMRKNEGRKDEKLITFPSWM
jgi:hypothetical protein